MPDSGIPAETISRARESLKGNTKSVSKNGPRTWELSGGVSLCSECGRHMVAYTTRNSAKKTYHYYRCSNREHHACSIRRNYPAQGLEMQIKGALEETFQPETWSGYVNDICEPRLSDLHKLHRPNAKGNLLSRVSDLEMQMSRARHLFIKGDLPHPEYEENKTTLQDQIEVVQKELSKVENLDVEIERVEKLRRTLMSIEDPLSGHYAFIIDEESDIDLLENENDFKYGFGYGSRKLAAKRRQEFYRRSGLTVRVGEELEISLGVGEPIVSKLNTASASSSG